MVDVVVVIIIRRSLWRCLAFFQSTQQTSAAASCAWSMKHHHASAQRDEIMGPREHFFNLNTVRVPRIDNIRVGRLIRTVISKPPGLHRYVGRVYCASNSQADAIYRRSLLLQVVCFIGRITRTPRGMRGFRGVVADK
uniref:Putative secreted protein n=1 Tax=Anopheles triannulatus TaxID=58253 RepID=A0A2M4B3L6_9DIPT